MYIEGITYYKYKYRTNLYSPLMLSILTQHSIDGGELRRNNSEPRRIASWLLFIGPVLDLNTRGGAQRAIKGKWGCRGIDDGERKQERNERP